MLSRSRVFLAAIAIGVVIVTLATTPTRVSDVRNAPPRTQITDQHETSAVKLSHLVTRFAEVAKAVASPSEQTATLLAAMSAQIVGARFKSCPG
jgi:phytoene/squalene synthetase